MASSDSAIASLEKIRDSFTDPTEKQAVQKSIDRLKMLDVVLDSVRKQRGII